MLTLEQSNELNRALKLQLFLNGTTSIFSGFVPFNSAYVLFKSNVSNFSSQAGLKDASGTSITQTKGQLKKSIATTLAQILGKTVSYCDATGNTTLRGKVDFSESDIFKTKDSDILPFVTNLVTNVFTAAFLADPVFATYNITAAQIAAVLADATTFNGKIGAAGVVDSGASTANDSIDTIITAIHKNINTMDNLVGDYKVSRPDFYSNYHKNSELEKIGTHHSGIQGVCKVAGEIAKNVKVEIVDTDKKVTSDLEGHYTLIKAKPGTCQVRATAENGASQTKNFNIRRGHIDELDFDL